MSRTGTMNFNHEVRSLPGTTKGKQKLGLLGIHGGEWCGTLLYSGIKCGEWCTIGLKLVIDSFRMGNPLE